MIGDIRKHLEMTPFVPFRIRTADGREYPVPTQDHIYFPPASKSLVVADDEGIVIVIPARQIGGLVYESDSSGHNKAA